MSVLCQSMSRGAAVLAAALLLSSQAMGAGILRYATIGEPPSLDVQMGTATIAGTIGNHMFETLYAFDSQYKPQPLLATGEKIEDGGKTPDHLVGRNLEQPGRLAHALDLRVEIGARGAAGQRLDAADAGRDGDDERRRRRVAQALGRIRRARPTPDEERHVAASNR